ncbi:MAG: Exosortase/archaeosortase family protein, partial [Thermoproteota archaeon]|nr:Exosortase/archaeosortase family protein [Thermoproteota archaeon]
MQICPTSARFNKYKVVPIHNSRMPSSTILETKRHCPRKIIFYIVAVTSIILVIYYIPNYLFLEKATADYTALVLNSIGIRVETHVVGENVFLADIKVVKDCTGVQVIAVFFGLIIPIPNAPMKKKLLSLVIISTLLYISNVLRIALEFSLVYFKMLPWSLAHYPLSLLLGVLGVLSLILITERLLPEFGDFVFNATC